MDKHDLNNEIFDRLIEYAAERSMENLPDCLPSDEELDREVSLRPEFEKRMNGLFQAADKKFLRVRRRRKSFKIAAVVAAALIVFTSVMASVEAFRVPVLNFFLEKGDMLTTIHVEADIANYNSIAEKAEGLYLPSYIPEGYTVHSLDINSGYYCAVYLDGNQNQIVLQRLPVGSTVGIDSEDAINESLIIQSENAQYFEKKGLSNLLFTIEDNFFTLSGVVGKSEIIKIAESMKIYGA